MEFVVSISIYLNFYITVRFLDFARFINFYYEIYIIPFEIRTLHYFEIK